jgi:hypothetical protein
MAHTSVSSIAEDKISQQLIDENEWHPGTMADDKRVG